jgi:hypothetical protein
MLFTVKGNITIAEQSARAPTAHIVAAGAHSLRNIVIDGQ